MFGQISTFILCKENERERGKKCMAANFDFMQLKGGAQQKSDFNDGN